MDLSIIIPFYNAETTIPALLAGFPYLDRPDVEYIFINDGSEDRGKSIIEDFIASHPQIEATVINHSSNLGVSAAYADGLQHAKGKYVTRMDADDRFLPDSFRDLVDFALTSDADIVCAPYLEQRPGKIPRLRAMVSDSLNRMPVDTASFSLSGKLIRRSLLTDHSLTTIPGLDCWEDLFLLSRAYALAPTVVLTQSPVFVYNVDSNAPTLSRSPKSKILNDRITYAAELEKWLVKENLEHKYLPFLEAVKFNAKIKYLRTPHINIRGWLAVFPEINRRVMQIKNVPLIVRIGARIISFLSPFFSAGKDNA